MSIERYFKSSTKEGAGDDSFDKEYTVEVIRKNEHFTANVYARRFDLDLKRSCVFEGLNAEPTMQQWLVQLEMEIRALLEPEQAAVAAVHAPEPTDPTTEQPPQTSGN
jgi:hypothetical protein